VARIHDLIRQVAAQSPDLARDLEREVDVLSERRAFGLNFERHTPEEVELPGRPVRRGDKVHILPPRGETPEAANSVMWVAESVDRAAGIATVGRVAANAATETQDVPLADLVVVAEFRDPIYPGLVSTGTLERGGDKPHHSVINGENFHVLQTLLFTHRGKVDAIYIDPPYNTGARDWKYNNDYVDAEDAYRHSKWLAFMERRLELARRLLNPESSVLIVTIDEKEYLRLGLLLEQTFLGARIQMVTSVINPAGTSRKGVFSRSDEYLFFVFVGEASVVPGSNDMLNQAPASPDVRWDSLQRRGDAGRREGHPDLFYGIYFDQNGVLAQCGPALPYGTNHAEEIAGLEAVVPVKEDGTAMRWGVSGPELMRRLALGAVRYYKDGAGRWVIRFLQSGTVDGIQSGTVVADGTDDRGFPKWVHVGARTRIPMTTWKVASHSASDYATPMLSRLLPQRHFPFPKSLYAVEDSLRFSVANKPNAVIVDFFAGSGTTAHATMRLNKQDGGRRQSISVTNNEVAADEQRALRAKGLRPGDPDWERLGICDYIAKPRIEAAITGKVPDGTPIKGDYRFADEFPMADGFQENVEFFSLTYEAPLRVASHRDFPKVAPLLWLRAGSTGRRIDSLDAGWDVADTYGVLGDLDKSAGFVSAVAAAPDVRVAFVITDEDRLFEAIVRDLPDHVEPVRMYDAYLRNFELESRVPR
jgi:adenine-specific DNA-methyltransferase